MKTFDEFITGCQLIQNVDESISVYAEHDVIIFGNGKKNKNDYTFETQAQLEELGFRWFDDCWQYFT